jgi:hypothetical protein
MRFTLSILILLAISPASALAGTQTVITQSVNMPTSSPPVASSSPSNQSNTSGTNGPPYLIGAPAPQTVGPQAPSIRNVVVLTQSTTTLVEWTTATPALSTLTWGDTIDHADGQIVEASPRTDHVALITDLTPATTYYFSIEAAGDFDRSAQALGLSFRTRTNAPAKTTVGAAAQQIVRQAPIPASTPVPEAAYNNTALAPSPPPSIAATSTPVPPAAPAPRAAPPRPEQPYDYEIANPPLPADLLGTVLDIVMHYWWLLLPLVAAAILVRKLTK